MIYFSTSCPECGQDFYYTTEDIVSAEEVMIPPREVARIKVDYPYCAAEFTDEEEDYNYPLRDVLSY